MLKLGLGISLTNRIGAGGASFAFADLYASGEDGFIYDPSQSGLSDGDPVTGATDRINTNDATQATAANQPNYDLTAGVHSFQANGIDEWLRIPNFPIGSDFTAIFSLTDPVQDQTGASILRPLFSAADETGYGVDSNYYGLEFTKPGGVRMSINGETVEDTYTPDGSATVLTFRKEGTSAKIFRDGVEIASGTLSTTSGFATGDYALFANASDLGTGRAAKTDLYHVMFIDRALTAQEQSDAEALSATFAVPDDTVPGQMGAPSLVGGDEEATLTLNTSVISDGGSTITGYDYEVTDSADTGFASPVAQGAQVAENFGDPIILTPLAPDDYIARNRAVNAIGDGAWSAASSVATVTGTGDITPPAFNSSSYDDPTDTITSDVTEDSTMYVVYSTTNSKPSQAQMAAGENSSGVAAALAANFTVTEAGTNEDSVATSGLADGTYYIFLMLEDAAGNRSAVTDAITDTKVTPVVNYVDQATNDPAFEFSTTGETGFDYWFFAASLQATSPESTSAARVYATTGDGSYFFYDVTNKTCNIVMRDNDNATIYGSVYPLDLSVRKHVAFKYDGLTATPTLWVDGQAISPSSVGTAATTGSLRGVFGLSIFDRDSGGRSLRAEEVSQLIVATEDYGISDVWDSINSEPRRVISNRTAELILGEDLVAADWNNPSANNLGSKGSYTLTKIGGNFLDV